MSKARGLADLGNVYNDGALSNRNLVINGAMQVAVRLASVAGVTGGGYLTCDRMELGMTAIGTWTVTQASDGPAGFANSYKVACTTANAAPAAGAFMFVGYKIEGQDLQQLAKGTADAKPMVLSFWVKSNKIGTYQVSLQDSDNARQVAGTYTVDTSGTWEYKTIAVPADTTGAFDNDTNASLGVEWWLDSGINFTGGAVPTAWETHAITNRNAGSNVNLADTIGNYFQITGVQLEVGDTATPFEHRSYGQELALCQRYYYKIDSATSSGSFTRLCNGTCYTTITATGVIMHPVAMRTTPTLGSSAAGTWAVFDGSNVKTSTAVITSSGDSETNQISMPTLTNVTGLTQYRPIQILANSNTTAYVQYDAEL